MWRIVVMVLVLLTAVAAARGAAAQTPSPDLERLHQALLATPFDDSELPPGFAGAQAEDFPVEAAGAAAGEVANVDVVISSGPDALNGGAYTFYATEAQAHAALTGELLALGPNAQVMSIEPLKGYGVPATLITAVLLDPPTGVSGCVLQVGSIIVAAYSAIPDEPAGNPDNACALAVAMQDHLQRLNR